MYKTFSCITFEHLNQLKIYIYYQSEGKGMRGDKGNVLQTQVLKRKGN